MNKRTSRIPDATMQGYDLTEPITAKFTPYMLEDIDWFAAATSTLERRRIRRASAVRRLIQIALQHLEGDPRYASFGPRPSVTTGGLAVEAKEIPKMKPKLV